MNDEEYAIQLQKHFDQEHRERQASVNQSAPAISPSITDSISSSSQHESVDQIKRIEGQIRNLDEEFARRLADEMIGNEGRPAVRRPNETSVMLDEEYAKALQREMENEAAAWELQRAEQRAAHVAGSAAAHAAAPTSRRQNIRQRACSWKGISSSIFCLLTIGVALAFVFGLLGGGDVPIPFVPDIPDLSDVWMIDNWDYEGEGEHVAWKNRGGDGLELTLVNALDEHWHPFFNMAVQDWDNGTPDALALRTQKTDAESFCTPIVGKMKVCNGNYGSTGWKGVNEIVLQNDWITQSIAKMNEFYLAGGSDGERQYTMCHEIGHGFGLNHSDENFYNADLHTCMDYTNNPAANQKPNKDNYETLAELYIDGYTRNGGSDDVDVASAGAAAGDVAVAADASVVAKGVDKQKGGSRYVRRHRVRRITKSHESLENIQEHPKYESFTSSSAQHRSRWLMLSRTDTREVHELDLGGGTRVRAHVLLA
mmetsp:Transcript_24552/g.36011  ORF Transcript_24552/g.36011 Transcript_24552/m.36011 type:complete len:483 (-) Transcript_24552:171-1619(-)|eukprot:CAMPEP_0195523412 /NCGR_PEP_ID=MMETSP0794_2-20130614/22556_1 /TAXON_ID=515487 /ORGANISM="Stephanopyxis turris, Strain CCMP 815" /LENGTH=482 /DNA_ID=CAMNT_0040653405 /DNA_START=152 /DNA_END=1600 /DNA_ORIENTATION=-